MRTRRERQRVLEDKVDEKEKNHLLEKCKTGKRIDRHRQAKREEYKERKWLDRKTERKRWADREIDQ